MTEQQSKELTVTIASGDRTVTLVITDTAAMRFLEEAIRLRRTPVTDPLFDLVAISAAAMMVWAANIPMVNQPTPATFRQGLDQLAARQDVNGISLSGHVEILGQQMPDIFKDALGDLDFGDL
jgi:hypothetical protein